MLDPDISTEDAKRLLSFDDQTRTTLDRRRFLQLVGGGVLAGAAVGTLGETFAPGLIPGRVREAWAGAPIGPTDGILVLVGLDGGNDFLNTFVPYTNSYYYSGRPNGFAIPASQVLPLNGQLGLNPRLPYVKTLYDRGEVAVLQGVGYPQPDRSHFNSMAIWMHGKNTFDTTSGWQSGWVGRWVDGLPSAARGFASVAVGQYLPLHMLGLQSRGIAVPPWGLGFGTDTRATDLRMYDGIRNFAAQPSGRGALHDAMANGMKEVINVGQDVAPVFSRDTPEGRIQSSLTVAARMINADLGLRVIDTSYGGFDTHSSQPADFAELMDDLNAGLYAFFTSLDDRFRSRVTVMTYSEFGRTHHSNDSTGTDHGTVSTHMLIGAAVRGGIYGALPNLNVSEWADLAMAIDFRSMYASVIDGWLGGGSSTVLGANYTNLNLFRTGPGAGVAGGSVPAAALGDFVPVTPARLYDSRDTAGFRKIGLGAGAAAEVQVTGQGGVPASGVTAVALNVTAPFGATEKSVFNVWPEGDARPDVASVGVVTARSVPNLAIVKVGRGGRIHVGNDLGVADAVVDVIGYFQSGAANRLQSMSPFRALDTRDGTGGRSTPLGAAATYDVTVRGVGGIPTTAEAVVVNLTAVQPTARAYASLYPSGVTRPNSSTLNFDVGLVIANLAIIKVGSNGKLSLYNHAGNTHYVMDILGYMLPGATGRYMPIAPGRVLDTRTSAGGSGPMTGGGAPRLVTVTGLAGVPASGVASVALNVSVRNPTANGFVTLWPNGVATRPNISNLNPRAGIDVNNLVICQVGTSGRVQLYLHSGKADFVVDAVGYFTT